MQLALAGQAAADYLIDALGAVTVDAYHFRGAARGHVPEGFLFHNRRGHSLSAAEGAFQKAVRASGIGDFHFHDLRHTFSTRVRRFTDAFTVRDLMGHAKVDTTDIYVTNAFDEQRHAVDALCNLRELHQAFTAEKKTG